MKKTELKSSSFVYVDAQECQVRFLTGLMSISGEEQDISALAIAEGGSLEVLSTEN